MAPSARVSTGCALGTLAVASAVLVGWATGHPAVSRLLPSWPRTLPWTAVGLALAAAGVLAQRAHGRWRVAGPPLGLAAALLGATILVEYVAGVATGIDRLLFADTLAAEGGRPGRPAPQTALLLVTAGTAVLLLRGGGKLSRRAATAATAVATGVVAVVSVGYAYGARELFSFAGSAGMVLPTALAGGLLCLAVITARPDRPPLVWLVSDRLDSVVVTRLLPVVATVPLLGRLFDVVGGALGLPSQARNALAELAVAVVLGILVVHTGRARRRTEQALLASETRYRLLADGATDLVTLHDADDRLTYVSPSSRQVLGHAPEDVAGHAFAALAHPDDAAAVATPRRWPPGTPRCGTTASTRSRSAHCARWRARVAGERRLVAQRAGGVGRLDPVQHARRDGPTRGGAGAGRGRARVPARFEHAPTGIAVVGLDGRLLQVNAALAELLGRDADEMVGTSVASLTRPDERRIRDELLGRLVAGELDAAHRDTELRHADGHDVPVSLHVALARRVDGSPAYVIAQIADLTERKRLEAELTRRARSDPLTGLPNRALLFDRLTHALAAGRRHDTGVGVLFVDLDDFKRINDTLGHEAGDGVLVAVAERLRTTVRASDSPARLGGDEFVVVCEPVGDTAELAAIRRRIAAALHEPIRLPGRDPVRVTASIGAGLARPEDDPASLLHWADVAMYDAKQRRRSTCAELPRPRTPPPPAGRA